MSFAVSPCVVGVPGGAIAGVFVPRYETDSTFASTSLQRNETAIAFASAERPFCAISTLQRCRRFQWDAQRGLQRCCRSQSRPVVACCARKSSPCSALRGCEREKIRPASPKWPKTLFSGALGELFRGRATGCPVLGELFRGRATGCPVLGELFRGSAAAGPHGERAYACRQSLRLPLISRGEISHAIPFKAFQMLNSDR